MNIILFNSPIYINKRDIKEDYLPPIGLGYIATYLKQNNIDVELIDCVYEHLGIDDILRIIESKKPEYIAINIFTPNVLIVKEIVERCKISTSFVIGGQVTKFIYNDIIQWNTKNDVNIVIGEGEYITSAIVKNEIMDNVFVEKNNKRVYCVDNRSLYYPRDISSIKLDRSFFIDREIKNIYGEQEACIVTSRGCIYNCAFCGAARSLNDNIGIRERSQDSIINEISDIIANNPKINSIRILDDLFLKDKANIEKSINIFERFNNISWRSMAHILSFKKSKHLLPKLKESGCKELFIGIESGSQRIRKSINKSGSVKEITDVIYKILKSGINVKGYFIYGFPEEDIDDFNKTYSLANKLKEMASNLPGNFRCSVFQFRPYHGTELYKRIVKKHKCISEFTINDTISRFDKRVQFNYQSGNYSQCTSEQLNKYIIKTLELNDGE